MSLSGPRRLSAGNCAGMLNPRSLSYRPYAVQKRAEIWACHPKPGRLDDPALAAVVEERLRKNWSPQQISDDLAVISAGLPELQVSHETIYQSLFVQGQAYVGLQLTPSTPSTPTTLTDVIQGTKRQRGPKLVTSERRNHRPRPRVRSISLLPLRTRPRLETPGAVAEA